MRCNTAAMLLLFISLSISMVESGTYPVGVTNCGRSSWIKRSPQRAVTLNQGATEVMLALKLADRMVGTAYLDDEIWPELEDDYNKIAVLSEKYPTAPQLFAVNPDFLFASYRSAFSDTYKNGINYTAEHLNECSLTVADKKGVNHTYCRQELEEEKGIVTYLQQPGCEQVEHRSTEVTLKVLFDEIWDMAKIFNVFDEAQKLINQIDDHFDQAQKVVSAAEDNAEPIKVLWLDGYDDKTPFVGACCGAVQVILERAGAKNIFEDLGTESRSSWDKATWDQIVERDPDLIVLVDASWSSAGNGKLKKD